MNLLARRHLLAAGLAVLCPNALAQAASHSDVPTAMREFFQNGRYIPRWLAGRNEDTSFMRYFAAFVGDEGRALAGASEMAPLHQPLGRGARARDAIAFIRERARGRRVVVLNEAHTASRHRLFLARVLRALRRDGFTHLACENFLHSNTAGAPDVRDYRGGWLNPALSLYAHDPVFAEAIREAAELGFHLIPYDMRRDQQADSYASASEAIAAREQFQADNLSAALAAAGPTARFVVYAGYSHARERPDPEGRSWMAARLFEATGIDPLTIEQSTTGSFAPFASDSALTREVLERFTPERVSVVIDNGQTVGAAAMSTDIAVFHPNLPNRLHRPGWLAADPKRRRAEIAIPSAARSADEPVLVQAVRRGEPEHCIPADQYLLSAGAENATFYLRRGAYAVRLETLEGFQTGADFEV